MRISTVRSSESNTSSTFKRRSGSIFSLIQPPLHHGLRLRAILALDERSKPGHKEEDLAVLLDVG